MDHDCSLCELAGACTRHPHLRKVGPLLRLCRGGGDVDPRQRAKYLALWDAQSAGEPPPAPKPYKAKASKPCCGGKRPTLWEQVKSVAGAAVDVVRHGTVGSAVAESRLNLCWSCEHLGTRFGADSCNLCECLVSLKTEVPHESCPAHKWAEYDNRNWAVGMTTAPRRESTIRRALNGLRINGWEPTIFAEPGSDLDGIDAPIVQNETRLGCWLNFVREVTWLLDNTDSPMILTMQDDCELVPGARQLIDGFEWPDDAGFVSLWLPDRVAFDYQCRPPKPQPTGIHPIKQQNFHGSLAIAWRRETLRQVMSNHHAVGWLSSKGKHKQPHHVDMDDICIGRCVNDLGLRQYYAIPSCSQHVAEFSARENQSRHKAKVKAEWVAVNAWEDCRSSETATPALLASVNAEAVHHHA